MRIVRLFHNWAGAGIGVLLALLGLTGALLVWKGAWIGWSLGAPSFAPATPAALAKATQRMIAEGGESVRYITYADAEVPVHTVRLAGDAGFYAASDGTVLAQWSSIWDRPELWLFDLHHHLMVGDAGETIAGIAGLFGIAFVITGTILWWKTRRKFRLRLWPATMKRKDVVRHHRNLGAVMAPLLFITMLTGTMMTLRPVAQILLLPFSPPSEVMAALEKPDVQSRAFDAASIPVALRQAQATFPNAVPRILILPGEPDTPLGLRLKQPDEWHNNGRTTVLLDAASGGVLDASDALAQPRALQINNAVYPIHAAKIGGWLYKIALTFSGMALTMLGTLAFWSFWKSRLSDKGTVRGQGSSARRPKAFSYRAARR